MKIPTEVELLAVEGKSAPWLRAAMTAVQKYKKEFARIDHLRREGESQAQAVYDGRVEPQFRVILHWNWLTKGHISSQQCADYELFKRPHRKRYSEDWGRVRDAYYSALAKADRELSEVLQAD
jgi:hypothetical protein